MLPSLIDSTHIANSQSDHESSEEEEKNGTISVRRNGQEGKGNISVTIEQFAAMINEEINKTLKQF